MFYSPSKHPRCIWLSSFRQIILKIVWRPAYDVGVVWRMRRENKTKWRSRIRSTKRGFVKKNVEGFRYKPRGDWFSFAKVRKVCFLCSSKQTRETSISQRRAMPTSYVICRNGLLVWQSVEVRKNVYYIWNMDIFVTKTHGFATGGLYPPPPRSRGRHVLLRIRALYFTSSGLLTKSTRLPLL